jgi:hypothetical protein
VYGAFRAKSGSILGGFAQDLHDDLDGPVERLLGLGLSRLDQQRLLNEQRDYTADGWTP